MKWKELAKRLVIISNWKKTFGLHGLYKLFQHLKRITVRLDDQHKLGFNEDYTSVNRRLDLLPKGDASTIHD